MLQLLFNAENKVYIPHKGERKNILVDGGGGGDTKVSIRTGGKRRDHWIPCPRDSRKKFKNIILGQWLPKSPCDLLVVIIVITFKFNLLFKL